MSFLPQADPGAPPWGGYSNAPRNGEDRDWRDRRDDHDHDHRERRRGGWLDRLID